MLEPVLSLRARDAASCVLLQLGGLLIVFYAGVCMHRLATSVMCDFGGDLSLLRSVGPHPTTWIVEYGGAVILSLLAWGNLAPLLAIPMLRGTSSPVAIQMGFTASQLLVMMTLWLGMLTDFPRSH